MKKQYLPENTVSGSIAAVSAPLATTSRMYQQEDTNPATLANEANKLAENAYLIHEAIKSKKITQKDLTLLRQANILLKRVLQDG